MSTRPEECGTCGLDHPSSEPCPKARKAASRKIAVSSNLVGYWARNNNLTLQNVLTYEPLAKLVIDPSKFQEGWQECDDELLQERLGLLLIDLDNATGQDVTA